jgi:hypothetical protein
MDKLNTSPLGGVKLHQDDLEFWHNSNKDIFKALFEAIGGNLRIGATTFNAPDPGGFDIPLAWNEGYIFVDGECYKVVGGGPININSDPSDGQQVYWALEQSYDPGGNETNIPGALIDTYIFRRAIIKESSGPANVESDFLALVDTILPANKAIAQQVINSGLLPGSWINFGALLTNFANATGNLLRYRKESLNVVRLSGAVKQTAIAPVFSNFYQLPVGYRPARNLYIPLGTNSGNTVICVISASDGYMLFNNTGDGSDIIGQDISLEPITFSIV